MTAAFGTDLEIELLDHRALSIYRVRATERRALLSGRRVRLRDFETVTGRDSLAQALVMRLLTPKGELAALGHPGYGSRLHEVVGAPNTDTTLNRAKLFVIEALKQERRVERVLDVTVTRHPVDRQFILIAAEVQPIGEVQALALGPVLLEL
jgi:phage baseplate assembly protein W